MGLILLYKAGSSGIVAPHPRFVTLDERFKILREVEWQSFNKESYYGVDCGHAFLMMLSLPPLFSLSLCGVCDDFTLINFCSGSWPIPQFL